MPDPVAPSVAARLYSVARGLTGALTAVDVAASVFERVEELGAATTGLWLVEAGTIRLAGGAGLHRDAVRAETILAVASDRPPALAVRTGRIVTIGSPAEGRRRWPALDGVLAGPGARAVLPLVASGRALGCLHVGYRDEMHEADFDLRFLDRLSELCAAALDRAQLHDAERDRQAFLLEAAAATANAQGLEETLGRLAAVAVPRLADLCLIDIREAPQRVRRMAAAHADPAAADLAAELGDRYPPEPGGAHPAVRAMVEGRSRWQADMSDEFLRATTRDERHFELTKRLRLTSFMCVPLMAAGESLGAITLISAGSGRRFGAEDLALAEDLAHQVADVVAAALRLERERQVAHALQRLLLPSVLPAVPGLEVCARYLTARGDVQAGGDFYDVVELPSGRVGFVIGDVEGHDPEAAALMGQLRSAIRALAGQQRRSAGLIDALRWSWDLLGFTRLATCLVGRLDPEDGTAVMCSAGHLPPILVAPDGAARLVEISASPPLGVPAGPATEVSVRLEPGSTLLLYTDGLVESARTGIDEELERLRRTLASAAGDLDGICDRILAGHAPAGDHPDDVAVLAIRLSARPAGRSGPGPAGAASSPVAQAGSASGSS